MEVIRLPKHFWMFCGFYFDESTSSIQRWLGIIVNILIVFYLSMLAIFVLLLLYFDDNVTTESILNIGYELVTSSAAVLTFIVVSLKKDELIGITIQLQQDVNRRNKPETIHFYEKAEKHCDYATKLPIIYSLLVFDVAFLLYILVNWVYEAIIGDVNVGGWFYIYVFW